MTVGEAATSVSSTVAASARFVTVPGLAWLKIRLWGYCDGFALQGDRDTLELDARKRYYMVSHGSVALSYWGRTILEDPGACARQISQAYRQRVSRPRE